MKISRPIDEQPLSDEAAHRLVDETTWYHSFVLRPGIETPGDCPYNVPAICDSLKIPSDLRGMKCLEIGPMDGPMTFELERRGGHVMALDVQDPTRVGFDSARRVIGSKAVHYEGSVYGLPHDEMKDLDLVVFCGVWYHLKYPILAFERMSLAMKVGATLHFEGEALLNYAETLDGKPSGLAPDFVAEWDARRVPVCASYPNRYMGMSNWFVPNAACLESWLQVSGFEVREMNPFTEHGNHRLFGHAVKVSEVSEQLEHPPMGAAG